MPARWTLVWTTLTEGLAAALEAIGLRTPERVARIELAVPRDPSHGDWTTNLALLIARDAKRPPRAVAESLAQAFPRDPALFASVEVAGPGFLNFRYAPSFLAGLPGRIEQEGDAFGRSSLGEPDSILVEYVSANPTGPLNVVSARAAAVGSTLVRLLAATGHRAAGEFYVNDAGRQVELLGESLAARFAERAGVPRALPEDGYQGEYLKDLAARLPEAEARAALARPDGGAWFRDRALEQVLEWQRDDLAAYGVTFSRWFRETTLHAGDAVGDTLRALEARGMVYRAAVPETGAEGADNREEGAAEAGRDEATWLRTSRFGDEKDRVLVRGNGVPTYLLPDIAYHRDKAARGFRHLIDLWGPDHHGYIPRMQAALQALGQAPGFLEVLIVQQVNLLSGGQLLKMSKRAGEFVTLRDLVDEVGADCAKFFFLLRSTSAHLDFDLDLARRQNDENPAYYVQYAHARIASLLRFAAEKGLTPAAGAPLPGPEVAIPECATLIRKLSCFPEVVRGAAAAREPHRVPTYLMETAADFHRFYHACRVVSEDRERSRARLLIAAAARRVIANGLALMGVSAPERMERAAEVEA
jgi:arginyl-tRNA synthetase